MNRLLLAGLLVTGWAAAGIGQAPPTPMPPAGAGAGVQGTITTQPATGVVGAPGASGTVTGTGLMIVPGTTVSPSGVMQGGYTFVPSTVGGGLMQAGSTGPISGVVTGNCGLTTGVMPMMMSGTPTTGTMTAGTMVNTTSPRTDGGRRLRLRR